MTQAVQRTLQSEWARRANLSDALSEALIAASCDKRMFASADSSDLYRNLPSRLIESVSESLGATKKPGVATDSATVPAQEVVARTRVFLDAVPGGGARLHTVSAEVSSITGYREEWVRSIIVRNFPSNGRLVWR